LTHSQLTNALILAASCIAAAMLVWKFLIPAIQRFRPKNDDLPYRRNPETGRTWKRISKNSLFSIGRMLIDENDYFFEENNIYEITRDGRWIAIPMNQITEVIKTSVHVNGEFIWQIKFQFEAETREFKLIPSSKFFNNPFIEFLDHLRANYPNIKTSRFSLFWFKFKT